MVSVFYRRRINAVIDYIEAHLDERPSLARLAAVGGVSAYHFHRIFKAATGETLLGYLTRLRMARIGRALLLKRDRSLTDIAFDMGYGSSSNFSRDVRRYYRSSPSALRKAGAAPFAKPSEPAEGVAAPEFLGIKRLPGMVALYTRLLNGYNPDAIRAAFAELCSYAARHFPRLEGERLVGVGYDDPDYTEADKCRYDACIALKRPVDLDSVVPFNYRTIEGGPYAAFRYAGAAAGIAPAWGRIFSDWVLRGEYLPDDRPHLELYAPSPRYEEGVYEAELCLPVAQRA